jgi:hypothetical protein
VGVETQKLFLTPSRLPPRTPLFHDVDTTGSTRLLASQ